MLKSAGKLTALLVLIMFSLSSAQERVEEKLEEFRIPFLQPRKLIDCPTAGLLPRGSFDFDIRIYPEGGVTTALEIGITNRLMIGISFGGQNVIGEGRPNWNPDMEFAVKYRFLHESYFLPAFAMGYDGQGYGAYDDSLKRYTYKSKGFYAVISKSYLVGTLPLGLHGGINYSLEDKDDENVPIYVGCDLRMNEGLGLVLEYDVATNDDYEGNKYGQGWGYLNFGIQWFFSKNLLLEVDLKNVFKNREDVSTLGREFRVVYFEFF